MTSPLSLKLLRNFQRWRMKVLRSSQKIISIGLTTWDNFQWNFKKFFFQNKTMRSTSSLQFLFLLFLIAYDVRHKKLWKFRKNITIKYFLNYVIFSSDYYFWKEWFNANREICTAPQWRRVIFLWVVVKILAIMPYFTIF